MVLITRPAVVYEEILPCSSTMHSTSFKIAHITVIAVIPSSFPETVVCALIDGAILRLSYDLR